MKPYDHIVAAIHERAIAAKSRCGEFETIDDVFRKLTEEFIEVKDEVIFLRSRRANGYKVSDINELYERIADESIDVATVAIRLAHTAQMLKGEPK